MNALTSNKFSWLLRREYWEHKGGIFWAPAIVGAIMSFFVIITVIGGLLFKVKHGIHINGEQVSNLSEVMSAEKQAEFAAGLASGYMGTALPLFGVLALVVFFYCLSSLYDERKDRSVLFWKSLPVSDYATVASKLTMTLLIAPALTVALATATAGVIALTIASGSAFAGVNLFGVMLTTPEFYLAPLKMLALLPVYAAWALPTVGWLMMVSAWARTKPFLWAVGAPLLTGALISWFNALFEMGWKIEWFWAHVIGRGLLSVVPGSWLPYINEAREIEFDSPNPVAQLLGESWTSFSLPTMWIGLILGAAMIYVAIRLRRHRDEG